MTTTPTAGAAHDRPEHHQPATNHVTATITPAVSWLQLLPPSSGQVSATAGAGIVLSATRPPTYGVYQATLTVTGTTNAGAHLVPAVTAVTLHLPAAAHRLQSFPVLKNVPLP